MLHAVDFFLDQDKCAFTPRFYNCLCVSFLKVNKVVFRLFKALFGDMLN
jgi:hypothetical protein